MDNNDLNSDLNRILGQLWDPDTEVERRVHHIANRLEICLGEAHADVSVCPSIGCTVICIGGFQFYCVFPDKECLVTKYTCNFGDNRLVDILVEYLEWLQTAPPFGCYEDIVSLAQQPGYDVESLPKLIQLEIVEECS